MLPLDIKERLILEDKAIKCFIELLINYKPKDLNIGNSISQTIKEVLIAKNKKSVIGIIDDDKVKPPNFHEFSKVISKHERYIILQHKEIKPPRYLICIKPPYESFIYHYLSPDKNFQLKFDQYFNDFKYFEKISKRISKSSTEYSKYNNCITN